MRKLLFITCALFALASCDKTDTDIDKPNEPILFELSIDTDETITDTNSGKEYIYIKTDDYDYGFDIISGNGDYKLVESNDCRVTIENESVIINMYNEHSNLILEDSEGLQELVWIRSSNDMFNSVYGGFTLSLSLPEGNSSEQSFNFGVGDYTIECIKGTSATAEFISNNSVKFTPKRRGTTHFEVKDGRGLSVPYEVLVSDNIDMRDHFSNVDVIAEDYLNILIDKSWNWEIRSVKSDSMFKIVTIHRGDDSKDFDYLQVNIAANVEKDETGLVKLISDGGLEVEIRFDII